MFAPRTRNRGPRLRYETAAPNSHILKKGLFSAMGKRGRYRHRDRNRSRNRYRKVCTIGLLCIDTGSAIMPKPIAIATPTPIVTFPGVVALLGCGHWPFCTTNLKILAKKERIFQHHGMTVGVGIGIGIAIAVAIAIENSA